MTRHGTNSCYAQGCRLPACRAAHASYERSRRRRDAYTGPALSSASPWREILRTLTMPTFTIEEISNLTGVSPGTLVDIREGRRGEVTRRTRDGLISLLQHLPSEEETA